MNIEQRANPLALPRTPYNREDIRKTLIRY
jgi:hypothetical protein